MLIALFTAVVAPAPAQAAGTPSTSPKVIPEVTSEVNPPCRDGYACAHVLGDSVGNYRYIFRFYTYNTYNLNGWTNWGYAINRQTNGASMRLLNQSGGLILCVPPKNQPLVDWYPVWKIQLSPTPC
ncbi:hypothetical protein [Asanoa ishikariensis]|uniref:hypothetical protein n=1 Tax=Asanoa ishikariensis TaxID=137265 RepID=UPI00115F8453|nr:hypothetical protein [Asanoa ishikariensis]